MKRFFTVIVTIIAFWSISCNTAFAASNTYALDELELQVTIPTGYSVITRNTSANDPIFSDFGTTKSVLIRQFEASNIYLNAVSDTHYEEIVVTMVETHSDSLSLYSDTELNILASTLVNQYANYGIDAPKYEIYQHSQTKFIKSYFADTDNAVHGLQYYTIYDGKAMNFTMRSYEGSLSSRQEETIKTIVDSIIYDHALPAAAPGEDTNEFTHTDTDSGVTFTVPTNWKQEDFTKDREFIDVKFVSTKEDGCMIIFGSIDMWGQMSASDRVGHTRADLNNSAFTKSDIAAMYNTTADKISTVTYNGVPYFKGEINHSYTAYGLDILATMTQLIHIDNGWIYMFQFGGTSANKLYSDFESLLNSVQYPTVSDVEGIDSVNNAASAFDNSDNNSNDNSVIIAVILLLVIAAVIVIAVVQSRKKNTKTANHASYAPICDTPAPELSDKSEPAIFCENCGQALLSDSKFCYVCGTPIIKGEPKMICNKCNHELPDDSKFCPYCGNKIERAADDEASIDDMTPEEALNAILKMQAKETIKTMEANSQTQPNNEGDVDFGLVPEKPIFTLALMSAGGEKEYLNKLHTVNGEKIKYNRRGSISVDGINGMIDIYDTYLPSGQHYKTIYINMYGARKSTKAPAGFVLDNAETQAHPAP
ncbi:zinc ribbon domain-containing protein [Hominifimenecus sp. rT4P-3]|uniref:zinc ribbon domain-containing protein n=1 Tax=Hominifimenecus sp. rT4P-3 TaxID=3242979 RepID=UPI003DA37D69